MQAKLPVYKHHKDGRYLVLSSGNSYATDKEKWPTFVTYVSCETGEIFTREYDVFVDKFERVEV